MFSIANGIFCSCLAASAGFISKHHDDISADMWIRAEQMMGALAWIKLQCI